MQHNRSDARLVLGRFEGPRGISHGDDSIQHMLNFTINQLSRHQVRRARSRARSRRQVLDLFLRYAMLFERTGNPSSKVWLGPELVPATNEPQHTPVEDRL